MKQIRAILLALLLLTTLAGCGSAPEALVVSQAKSATLRIVTTYGGDDGNRPSFETAVAEYERLTGNTIQDDSDTSNENWKVRVMTEFETGSEPDVLFFFTDADVEPLIRAGKVVSLREIRSVYPDYASNMDPARLPTAFDGECYAVPTTGYWEYLFANRNVLEQCGVELPDADCTWEQFLSDCAVIRDAGFTPIACSLAEVAHYWFEYSVLNNGSADAHRSIPMLDETGTLLSGSAADAWIAGLEDIRSLYELQFFPSNTLTAGDAETFALFGADQAAFLLEGSWKVGLLSQNYADKLDRIAVCPVPGKGCRTADVAIGGISSGFFITRKAWENPVKREAAVDFVSYLTSDAVLDTFVTTEFTALNREVPPMELNPLQQSAAAAMSVTTRWVGAVQDLIGSEARAKLFENIPNVVSGRMTAQQAVETAIRLNQP